MSGNVILLNKPFLGGWLNREGNIGHEIIDFLSTDNNEYYVYNNPWGVCPDDIWIEGTKKLTRKGREKYIGKYLLLTSEAHGNDFEILYVIELSEKLHRYHTTKKEDKTEFLNAQNEVKKLIRNRQIKYNGKYLDEIYPNDGSLYVTFKGSRIYRAVNPIPVTGLSYNFQRNKGYLYDDEFPADYKTVFTVIEQKIANGELEQFVPRNVSPEQIQQLDSGKTFIDLIKQEDNEQVFTNILFSIFEQGDLLIHFCEKNKGNRVFNSNEIFSVSRETTVVDGRMDVCAESDNQRVIIENKINSGLNGLRPADNTTQLSTYYKWGKMKQTDPLCFIVAPNYRKSEIDREISAKDPSMVEIYKIITYGEIAAFIEEEFKRGYIPKSYTYYSLVQQIINAFKNLSYMTKEELYARLFLDATK